MAEALFKLDESTGIPLWIQLRNRLAFLIDSGYYANGDRLPTVRSLAAELEVNYHTVNKVYIELERDGYISSKRGRGAFVCKEAATHAPAPGDVILAEAVRQCLELGMTLDDVESRFARVMAVARRAAPADPELPPDYEQ